MTKAATLQDAIVTELEARGNRQRKTHREEIEAGNDLDAVISQAFESAKSVEPRSWEEARATQSLRLDDTLTPRGVRDVALRVRGAALRDVELLQPSVIRAWDRIVPRVADEAIKIVRAH